MTQYEIVEVHPLPRFDPSKNVKHVVLSPASVVRVNRMIRAYAPGLTACYFVGSVLFPVMLFARADIAAYTSVIEAILEVPSYLVAFLGLRADLLKLLVTSYDYWFFMASTVIFTVSFSQVARDWRVVLIASRWLGFQVPILIDAVINQSRSLVHAIMINVVLIMLAIGAIGLDVVDGLTNATIAVSPHHSLSVRDLLVNAMVTMQILLLRITIRKYEATRRPRKTSPKVDRGTRVSSTVTITCVTIRCAVKLQAVCVSAAAEKRLANAGPMSPPRQHSIDRRAVQLRRTASRTLYDSASILAACLLPYARSSSAKMALQATGYIAAGLTLACCYLSSDSDYFHVTSVLALAASVSSFLSTAVFVGVYVLFSNRQLLYRLCFSFDYIFLSLQITAAHVCFCDMLYWRLAPCATLVCAWLWIHWVITLDALTPAAKDWLGFHPRFQVVVIGLYFAGQVAACCAGLLWDWWDVQSRVILSTKVLGHTIEFTVLPFFASRLLTISVWTLRLLWRVCYEPDPDKLLLLRGQVEFELETKARAPPPAVMTQIVPFAADQRIH